MREATIINIGDELLIGQVINTNAAFISRQLNATGIDVAEVVTIGDDAFHIESALHRALSQSDIVLITGGLGPTKDDITKNVLCRFFGQTLVEDSTVLQNIKRIFDARGYELTETNHRQAWVPDRCTVINNVLGTAPCMWFDTDEGKVVVSLPGVPFEMEHLIAEEVVPRLQQHLGMGCILHKNIIVQGIGESFLSDLIEPWEKALPDSIKLAYLPVAGMVKLRLTARGGEAEHLHSDITDAVKKLYPLAGQYIVGEDRESVPELVSDVMRSRHLWLATAESCTGGAIASGLTALAGASDYFKGGVVAYSNEVKMSLLGVKSATLERYGAVSEQTAREMAEGVRTRMNADYGIATTGIAGPGGGTPDKPVGTVWTAIASADGTTAKLLHYGDRRQQTIDRTCNQILSDLIRMIKVD